MAVMYIANATRQIQEIQYRLPERSAPIMQRIPIGAQIKLAGDLSALDVDYILKQLVPYGLVEHSAVDRTKPFIGLIYSTEKPVPSVRVEVALAHNVAVLTQRGKDNRDLAAVAMSSELEHQLEQTRVAELQKLDVQIIEEDKLGRDTSVARISEGRHVDRNAPPGREPTRQRKKA